ncbi:DUF2909 domain-containing protein [Halomonas sp. Bachu 37]|uniref:DUF2909 domain-containing protein n=1 Tax=Halomonas kashgarensis TaxID=3084920 RepID=UPI003216E969
MWLKVLIALVFVAMLVSLVAGANFLLRDDQASRRLLVSLKWRISLGCLLIALLIYGFWFGDLG